MGQSQCPICYTPLEVRDVAPCMICGGWPEMIHEFGPSSEIREWRLPSGQVLALCRGCELEEFMVPGGWGFRLGLGDTRFPINALQLVRILLSPTLGKDKFCPHCNLRLSFLEVIASSAPAADASYPPRIP
jgi:hypothetical protein